MPGLRILRTNHVDNAILSGAQAIGSLPASNLKDEDIQRIWRSTHSGAQHILADLGAPQPVGVVAFINTNLGLTSSVRIRASNSDPTGQAGEILDADNIPSDVDPVYGMFVYFIEPSISAQYIRISLFNLTDAPEAGRLVIGPTWTPSRHFSFGWEQARQDHSRRAFSLGMNMLIDRLPRQKLWRFRLFGLTEDEVDNELEPLNLLNGASQDILVCRDKDDDNLGKATIWGLLDEAVTYSQIQETGLFEANFLIRERL